MKLDHGEAFLAAVAGLQRRFRAIQRGAQNNREIRGDEMALDVHAAIAEALVAKTLSQYCNLASSNRQIADVGTNVEVRWTPNPKGSLVFRPGDKDNSKYYLVTGKYPNIQVVGWKLGSDCQKDYYRIDKDKDGKPLVDPYWSIPQSDLNAELIEIEVAW